MILWARGTQSIQLEKRDVRRVREYRGELLYEGTGTRARFVVRLAFALTGTMTLAAILLSGPPADWSFGAILLVIISASIFATVAFLAALLWGRIVGAFAEGIRFPSRYVGPGHPYARRFVPYREIAWIFADGGRPLLGVKVGTTEGLVRHISQLDVEFESFLKAIQGRVPILHQDPELPRVLAALDQKPVRYEELWQHRDLLRTGVAVLVLSIALGAVTFILSASSSYTTIFVFGSIAGLAVLLAVACVAASSILGWRGLEANRFTAILWLDKAREDQILPSFHSALSLLARADRFVDPSWPLVERHRVYSLRSPGARLELAYTSGGEGSPAGWYVRLTAAKSDALKLRNLERGIARWGVESGLIPAHSARIHKALGGRVRQRDLLYAP